MRGSVGEGAMGGPAGRQAEGRTSKQKKSKPRHQIATYWASEYATSQETSKWLSERKAVPAYEEICEWERGVSIGN